MRFPSLLLLLLVALHLHAQTWELVTPIKTRSDLTAVRMHSPTSAVTIDRTLGHVLRTSDAGDRWMRMPYNLLNVPRSLWMWDDQRGIIGAETGRFYLTTDNWSSVTSVNLFGFGHAACLSFVNDTLGWAASESGKIARTTDAGASWTLQTSGTTNAIVGLCFVNDTLGFASATGAVLLRTTNGGDTWAPIAAPITYNMRGFHFFDTYNGLAVGIGGEIIRTSDAGLTWTQQPSPTTNSLLSLFARGDLLIAVGNGGVVMRSTNGGDSWSAQILEQFQDLYHAYIDPSGFGLLGGEARVYRTTDHGATWTAVQVGTYHTKLSKVSFGTDQMGAAAGWQTMGGYENGVIRTTDGGRHWTNVNAGNATWGAVHLRPNGIGWLGGGVGANRHTTDYFATSTNHPGPNVAIRSTWAFSASTALACGGYINGGCYRTTNGGSTWQLTLDGGNIFDLWFVNDNLGFAGGDGGVLARTTDGGASWEWLDPPTNAAINSLFFLNDTLGWYAGNGGARTTDGGDTWTPLNELPQFTMSIFFTDPDTGYAVQFSGYVLRTTDGGDSWETIVPAPFDVGLNDAQLVDGALLAVGDDGDVFRAALQCPPTPYSPQVLQSGTTLCTGYRPQIQWYLNGEPLPDATGPCITATEPGSYTVVTTDALGCVSAPSAPVQVIITGVSDARQEAPLLQPNPGTGTFHLQFAAAQPRLLELHDLQGRRVHQQRSTERTAVLHLEHLPAGMYLLSAAGEGWGVRVVKE
jgi:photosystem II stability/assembly factor-like uncharacterized protein